MVLTVRPRIEEDWKRLGFTYQTAQGGASKRYMGNLIIHGHRLQVIIEEHQNGTTSTWVFQPPPKLRAHRCVNERPGSWPGKGWYFIHYEGNCPMSLREAVNVLQLRVKELLVKGNYSSPQVNRNLHDTFWKRFRDSLR